MRAPVRAAGGKKLGQSEPHRANLLKVVELLLDLADEQSQQGWQLAGDRHAAQGRNQKHDERQRALDAEELQRALFVYWDTNKKGDWLLITSRHDDPNLEEKKQALRPARSKMGTIAVILALLKLTERQLDDTLMTIDTTQDRYWTNQIRDALTQLSRLGLRHDAPTRKGQPNSHYSFWIDFSGAASKHKSDCKKLIEKKWTQAYGAGSARTRQRSSQASDPEALRLAELDQWLQQRRDVVLSNFEGRAEVRERSIHVPLKVTIQHTVNGVEQRRECEPKPADFQVISELPLRLLRSPCIVCWRPWISTTKRVQPMALAPPPATAQPPELEPAPLLLPPDLRLTPEQFEQVC